MVMATAKIASLEVGAKDPEVQVSENTRQCVVCRKASFAASLLALGHIGDQLVLGRVGGQRGAYICPTQSCLNKLNTAAVSRTFRRSVKTDGIGEPVTAAHDLAGRRVREALGLSRRQGAVKIGVDALKGQMKPRGAVRIVARDLSKHSVNQLGEAFVFGTAQELGQHMGMKRVGALGISPGPMADRVAFWLRLWQETLPVSQSAENRLATGKEQA